MDKVKQIINKVDHFGITNFGTGTGDPFVVILYKHKQQAIASDMDFDIALETAWTELQEKFHEG